MTLHELLLHSRSSRPYWRDADDVHHVPKRPLAELHFELPGF